MMSTAPTRWLASSARVPSARTRSGPTSVSPSVASSSQGSGGQVVVMASCPSSRRRPSSSTESRPSPTPKAAPANSRTCSDHGVGQRDDIELFPHLVEGQLGQGQVIDQTEVHVALRAALETFAEQLGNSLAIQRGDLGPD